MELNISVSSESSQVEGRLVVSGVRTRVTIDGEPIGILQEITFRNTADGLPEATFRFPPESVIRQGSPHLVESYDKYVSLIRQIPWAVVANGDELAADSEIVRFFTGSGADGIGRTLSYMMSKDDSWFERTHDYVQWMLPTRKRSQYEPSAPTLTDDDIRAFQTRKDLRESYSFAVDRMKKFLELGQMRPRWVRPKDHNHKRISRMIESLRDLGFQERADRVLEQVLHIVKLNPGVVDETAIGFWKKASAKPA